MFGWRINAADHHFQSLVENLRTRSRPYTLHLKQQRSEHSVTVSISPEPSPRGASAGTSLAAESKTESKRAQPAPSPRAAKPGTPAVSTAAASKLSVPPPGSARGESKSDRAATPTTSAAAQMALSRAPSMLRVPSVPMGSLGLSLLGTATATVGEPDVLPSMAIPVTIHDVGTIIERHFMRATSRQDRVREEREAIRRMGKLPTQQPKRSEQEERDKAAAEAKCGVVSFRSTNCSPLGRMPSSRPWTKRCMQRPAAGTNGSTIYY